MIIAVTGHQSNKIVEGPVILGKLFQKTFLEANPEKVIVGMADGTDLIAGVAAIKTCFPVVAVIPWAGHQQSKYCVDCQDDYKFVKHFASEVIVLDDSEEYPGPKAFHRRNRYMVDNATHLLSYWDGKTGRGGTASTVAYSKGKIPMRNLYGQCS